MRLTIELSEAEFTRLAALGKALKQGLPEEVANGLTPEALASMALIEGLGVLGARWYTDQARGTHEEPAHRAGLQLYAVLDASGRSFPFWAVSDAQAEYQAHAAGITPYKIVPMAGVILRDVVWP